MSTPAKKEESKYDDRFERLCTILTPSASKTKKVSILRFLNFLNEVGIRHHDPRMKRIFQRLDEYTADSLIDPREDAYAYNILNLTKEEFWGCIKDDEDFVYRALTGDFVCPDFPDLCSYIDRIYEECKSNKGGAPADYIPQLARFDPNYWGVSICTVDGQRYSVGDTKIPFCLQSSSKCLNYAIALSDSTIKEVHEHVGREPSGRSFNELALDKNNRPHNPMINAGAISTAALLQTDKEMADRYDYTVGKYKRMAAGEFVGFSNSTFLSERNTADRNFALGYFMQENKVFPKNAKLQETLDLYFQLCSVEVTAQSAAVIAATLANGGVCPLNDDQVLDGDAVRCALSLMYSCGMYDYSGQFAFKVGLPAKSGVSGIVILVVPNVMGICTWSPPLDDHGNSVRGIDFCERMVAIFNFHNYDTLSTKSKYDPRTSRVYNQAHDITSLLTNAACGDVSALQRFHNKFGDEIMNRADYDGRTALHLAASEGHPEVVEFLLKECNANPKPVDHFDGTPLDDAKKAGFNDVVAMLEPYYK